MKTTDTTETAHPDVKPMGAVTISRNGYIQELEAERNMLREKYRMHHDEAERITKLHSEIMTNVRLIERVAHNSKHWGIRQIAREIISLENVQEDSTTPAEKTPPQK